MFKSLRWPNGQKSSAVCRNCGQLSFRWADDRKDGLLLIPIRVFRRYHCAALRLCLCRELLRRLRKASPVLPLPILRQVPLAVLPWAGTDTVSVRILRHPLGHGLGSRPGLRLGQMVLALRKPVADLSLQRPRQLASFRLRKGSSHWPDGGNRVWIDAKTINLVAYHVA